MSFNTPSQLHLLRHLLALHLTDPSHRLTLDDFLWLCPSLDRPTVVNALTELVVTGAVVLEYGLYRLHPSSAPWDVLMPEAIKRVALSLGWLDVPEALADGLHVLNVPPSLGTSRYIQLVLPVRPVPENWREEAAMALMKLSAVHNRPVWALVRAALGGEGA